MDYDRRIMGTVIRRLREERGLTQDVLSGLAGVARSQLALIEAGGACPQIDTLWRIAEALGIRLSELIRTVEDRTQHTAEER